MTHRLRSLHHTAVLYLERVLRKIGLMTPSSMLGNPPLESPAEAAAGTPKTDDLRDTQKTCDIETSKHRNIDTPVHMKPNMISTFESSSVDVVLMYKRHKQIKPISSLSVCLLSYPHSCCLLTLSCAATISR